MHYVCPLKILYKLLFSINALGMIAYSQDHLKTASYVKFREKTECSTGFYKIVNTWLYVLRRFTNFESLS